MHRVSSVSFIKYILAVSILLYACCAAALADVPHMIQYQGRLTDDAGNPLDTVVSLNFAVYQDSTGGSALWTEIHPSVTISEGLFNVRLGSITAIGESVFNGTQRWLGTSIDGGDALVPRTPIVSTAYSIRSKEADTAAYASKAGHATTSQHSDTADIALGGVSNGWVDAGNEVYLSTITDSVGIGVTNPSAPLDVEGPGHAIIGISHGSGTAAGVYGGNDSDGFGIMGISTSGRGVTGISVNGFGGHFFGPKNYFSSNLGIGTETPEEMLHIYKNGSDASSFMKIQSAHASNWGRAGIKFQTPQNLWWLFMDDDENELCPDGGLGLWNNSQGYMNMIWTKEGHIGIPTSSAQYQFAVYSPGLVGAILGHATEGNGVVGYSQTGFGGYFTAPKHYFNGLTGFATESPTHRVTVNGAIGIQQSGVTKFHINYYNNGFNISETTVADYRLYVKEGGNVGIGTSNPTAKLHVAGLFHADAFEEDAIDKYNIADEVGVAGASGDVPFQDLTSSWAPYLTCEITVPGAGYVLALGNAMFVLTHGISGNSSADIACSDNPNSLNGSYFQSFGLFTDVSAGAYTSSLTCQRLFSVPSKGTYTYYLIAQRDADNDVVIRYKQLRLLYIPSLYSSKNGESMAALRDDADASDISQNAEPEQIDGARAGERAIDSNPYGDVAALVGRVESLTAEIDALKRRIQAVENK